jgi:MoaA/NifB/PqqE/SkfB family radical SAM enzyme
MRGLVDTTHPLLAHLVPTRRCNLACTYCNEFDKVSNPVPTSTMLQRIDHLARLRTAVVAFSGGEPMLHPELDILIRRIRTYGMIAGLITNGYRLSPARINALNRAGLDFMQISIDNVEPDDVSKKSLRLLERKLRWLQQYAMFDVNINSVLGAGVENPEDAWKINSRARELGFSTSIGIIHDEAGALKPLSQRERAVYERVNRENSRGRQAIRNLYSAVNGFQDNLVEGKSNTWRCRAGARYLYIDEVGLVHYCSQQRGYPAAPLDTYTAEDIKRELTTPKSCAPFCTVGCAHRVSVLDAWRKPQHETGPAAS